MEQSSFLLTLHSLAPCYGLANKSGYKFGGRQAFATEKTSPSPSLGAEVIRGPSSNRNLHFRTRFQLDLVAVLVGQSVLDADLLIRVICPFDSDLYFVTFVGEGRFYDRVDSSRDCGTRLVGHVLSFGVPNVERLTEVASHPALAVPFSLPASEALAGGAAVPAPHAVFLQEEEYAGAANARLGKGFVACQPAHSGWVLADCSDAPSVDDLIQPELVPHG
jgi:hypothetical protein